MVEADVGLTGREKVTNKFVYQSSKHGATEKVLLYVKQLVFVMKSSTLQEVRL